MGGTLPHCFISKVLDVKYPMYLPKAYTSSCSGFTQLDLETIAQPKLQLAPTIAPVVGAYTDYDETPSKDPINMPHRSPPHSPPTPPYPDIFLKGRSLASSPYIHFSLYVICFFPTLLLIIVGGDAGEAIEWDMEDVEKVEMKK